MWVCSSIYHSNYCLNWWFFLLRWWTLISPSILICVSAKNFNFDFWLATQSSVKLLSRMRACFDHMIVLYNLLIDLIYYMLWFDCVWAQCIYWLCSSTHNFFHLVRNSSFQARTCIYVNKHLKLNQWMMKIIELNICLIKLQTSNLKDEIQMLRLINIYNSCSLSIIFTKESFTISRLNKLIKDDCEQLIVEDFNLYYLYWRDRRCFTHHTVTDTLLNIVTNTRLKLLLKSDTITKKIHNQLIIINLAFDSKKIQFMIHKCKMQIDLHQKSDHLLIVTKLCLRTSFMQLMTRWLWKKMNTEALNIHLKIHLFIDCFLNDKTAINNKVVKITHILQEVIEKFTSETKLLIQAQDFWNQICLKVMMKSRWLWVVLRS